jgi:hypothetical protein
MCNGKIIGSVIVVVVHIKHHQISRSKHLSDLCKHNQICRI